MGFRRPHISHGAGRELLRTQKSPLSFDSGLTNTPGSDFTPCSWGPTPTSGGSTRSARSPRPQALSPAQFPTQSALHRSRLRRSRGGPRRWSDVGRAKPRGELLRTQKKPAIFRQRAHKYSRQRPTLPRSFPRSTIGGSRLNFRVRNGNGCDPAPMTTGKFKLSAWDPSL